MRKRKNFFPTFLINVIFWIVFAFTVFFTQPTGVRIIVFYLSLFVSVFLTGSLLLANSRRGFLLSFFLVSILILRQLDLLNYLVVLLLSAFVFFAEYYSVKR